MTQKILITGGTGRVGSEIARLLLAKGAKVRVAARNPASASAKLQGCNDLVEFDFNRPETFQAALKGIDFLFLTVPPGDNHADRTTKPIVDIAKRNGVQLIVDLTAMGVERDETFTLRVSEKYIEASGIPFVHLRPNWFMQNFDSGPIHAGIRATGALHLPAADSKLSFIDARDVAEVASVVLAEPHHSGKAYTLTGIEALNHQEVVDILSRVSGKRIEYVPLTEEMACAGLKKAGIADELIERWRAFFRIVRQGLCAEITPDLTRIMGRSAIRFEQYAADHAAAWK